MKGHTTSAFWHGFFTRHQLLLDNLIRTTSADEIRAGTLWEMLTLHAENRIRVCYAPYGPHRPVPGEHPRVVIIGLTPGKSQAQKALELFHRNPLLSEDEHALLIRREVAFSGSMRRNLCRMLDELALPGRLGLDSSLTLFSTASSQLLTTSLLRYPVFVDGRNYTGHAPLPHKNPFLLSMIDDIFVPFLKHVPRDALLIPLGKAVSSTLRSYKFLIPDFESRTLLEFPHPSGANVNAAREFLTRKINFAETVRRVLSS